jgi:glycosyltransferase involved in cell wall biosynthesis
MPLSDARGGAEIMLLHLLRANRQTVNVDYAVVFLEHGPLVEEARGLGYPVQVFPAGKLRQLASYIRTVSRLYFWMKRERLNLVLSWMSKAHLYAGPAAALAGIGAVWYQHGIAKPNRMEKSYGYIPAKAVICPSRAAMAEQIKVTPKLPASVIYPSVDLNQYDLKKLPSIREVREALGLPLDRKIVGMVARLQRWKGVHVFLKAAEVISKVNPEVFFVVVGGQHALEPDYPALLQEQAIRSGISDRVLFAGHQTDAARWIQAFDILVHASYKEPFGMVIVEGMALGKPVIASKAGGPTETITHGVNGLLVPPKDAEGLASAIMELLTDDRKYERISRAAMERARQFSAERMANEVAELIYLKAGT